MALATEGKKVMLEAWGADAVRCALYDGDYVELTGEGYERQTISWTYSSMNIILDADEVPAEGFIAEFSVPAGMIRYVGFLKTDGTVMATHDLASNAETFTNPGVYQVLSASLEIDPSP